MSTQRVVLACGLVGLVLLLGTVGLIAWMAADLREASEADPIDCIELAEAVGQPGLPTGSSAASCTYVGFQDWMIEGTMTVERTDLDTWLRQLPGSPTLTETGCTEGVACLDVDLTQVASEVPAHHLDVAVLSEHDGVAEVHMSAFTT